ncbi:hypothetical protein ERO13_D09G180600v2 [Gossypium hirsutum]|uniref:Exonuclease mut-7 homolog isoform X2 n=1 Tax=Gossypium hirsutum TaxID=3635 RepID=A0A1U8I4Z7_GOSHI|nr:exonuclease mut-7 homolog isoform X2 [Gossypium hirsutum]KAG4130990.1 hypothetical protein ERO13_D09G180600v2 [Gossypium hirsutum]
MDTHIVSSFDSSEFTHLTRTLSKSTVIGLDAEWKPVRSQRSTFPTVTLLQLACQIGDDSAGWDESVVFLLDLSSLPLPSIWGLIKDVLVSPDILKLGFKFKQDLIYLSSTFRAQGGNPGFDQVEPYMDITNIYKFLQHKQGKKISKDKKSLSAICEEILGLHLSKELQCSDWSHRPLTEEQIRYAAKDAHCLLGIFKIFQAKVIKEGPLCNHVNEQHQSNVSLGLKGILEMPDCENKLVGRKFCNALDIVQATASSEECERIARGVEVIRKTKPMDESLWKIVRKYGEKLFLRVSDRNPKASRRKGKRRSSVAVCEEKQLENYGDWQGPPPWDISLGGDGCPKFLCDVMVEGLAKHLRCVGVDAAVPHSRKPEPRELIDQAYKEKRVLLTRDAKLLRHQYLIKNQIYRVNNLLKNEQLLEVIEAFQLKISEDQLMSRCTKCNGRFIQKPLTVEEAIEAAKGFQKIPNCLFDKNLEFWQCMDCNQLYWEINASMTVMPNPSKCQGTQYHNAVQKFIDVCQLKE